VNLGRGGLLSSNCDNVNNQPSVPLLFSNVPCRQQPPFNWGGGILTSYYPRVRPAAK
jgi:hypothetical protein